MQPYFFPYAGYFRLFAAADLFVALDCVQFPRRGWVHRNKLIDRQGNLQWLTLPLQKGDRDSLRICDLKFQSDAHALVQEQFRRFPALDNAATAAPDLYGVLCNFDQSPVDYLCNTMATTLAMIGINKPIVRSSSFDLPQEIRAQERIIHIARRVGASHYINAPGGRDIYESKGFDAANMSLNYLPDYPGSYDSILQRLLTEPAAKIFHEITDSCDLERASA